MTFTIVYFDKDTRKNVLIGNVKKNNSDYYQSYHNIFTSIISGTVKGNGYNCYEGRIKNVQRLYGTDGLYLPDGVWNNVKAHLEWINNVFEKKLTEEVRRDFKFTKRKCEGGSVGKADLLYEQCKS